MTKKSSEEKLTLKYLLLFFMLASCQSSVEIPEQTADAMNGAVYVGGSSTDGLSELWCYEDDYSWPARSDGACWIGDKWNYRSSHLFLGDVPDDARYRVHDMLIEATFSDGTIRNIYRWIDGRWTPTCLLKFEITKYTAGSFRPSIGDVKSLYSYSAAGKYEDDTLPCPTQFDWGPVDDFSGTISSLEMFQQYDAESRE